MSSLWSEKQNNLFINPTELINSELINSKKPSPKSQSGHGCPAQDTKTSFSSENCPLDTMRFIERISLPITGYGRRAFCRLGGERRVRFRQSSLLCGGLRGGMTVEASILLPLLLFVFLNLGCAIEMIRLHGNLQLALWQIGREVSLYGYVLDSGEEPKEAQAGEKGQGDAWWKRLAGIAFTSFFVKGRLTDLAGEAYLDSSPLTKGADGLALWESDLFGTEDIVDIVVTYSVSPWIGIAGFPGFRMANRYYSHLWNGYGLPGEEAEQSRTVYVTESASVYHLYRDCTHLKLSITTIPAEQAAQVRNQAGSRYRPCEKCTGGMEPGTFYVTKEGDCYHYVRECPGLKRQVRSLKLEEAGNLPLCSRCRQRAQKDGT